MKQIKFIAIFITTWLLPFSVFTQQNSFRNFSVANGLGSSNVNHIFQDSKGYIWIATQGGGVSKFNGKNFTTYTKADGLINNDVTFIAETPSGNIWIGTASGASVFNGNTFQNFNNKQGFTNGAVFNIYAEKNNEIYFATGSNGLILYNGNTFSKIESALNESINETFCIVKDPKGIFWIGTSKGIYTFQNNTLAKFKLPQAINDATFFSCFQDKNNNLFFGSTSGNFIKIDTKQNVTVIALPEICASDFIGSITQDNSGNYWLATDHGLLKYADNNFKRYSEIEGLSVDMVQAVLCDYEGNIWSGTLGGGIDVLCGEAFVNYNEKNGLLGRKVTVIKYDNQNYSYYIGTSNGLFILNNANEKIQSVAVAQNLNIIDAIFDKEGNLWLAALEGIFTIKKIENNYKIENRLEQSEQQKIISPTKIICDNYGNIWVTTFGSGLYKIRNNKAENVNINYDNISQKLLTIYEDSKGNVWIGTYDKGIGKLKKNTVEYIGKPSTVWSITEDNEGNIFWSTSEQGLYCYNGLTIKNYVVDENLLSDYISAIAWDTKNNCLWTGSETGLQYLIFSEKNEIERVENFNEYNGFIPTSINQNAIMIDTFQNSVWLGTINGLWNFSHSAFYNRAIPPRIQLTDIRLFYQKANWKDYSQSATINNGLPETLTLPYNKNHLTFDIQALTTREVHYVFKLDGQDENWSAPTTNNEITFSNIEPGKAYVFFAKAMDSDGIYSDDIIRYSFYIKPAWWNTWWFRTIAAIALLTAIFLYIKGREQALKNRNKALEQTISARTSEIRKQKDTIAATLNEKEQLLQEKEILLREIHHRVKNNLQTISSILMLQSSGLKDETAKKAIAESQSRVRSIALVHQKLYQNEGIEKIELKGFIHDLIVQIKSLFNRHKKTVDIHIDIEETYLLIDLAIPLGLILNELLTNSYKYAFEETETGTINISLLKNETENNRTRATLIYLDNGPGFNYSSEKPTTLGLKLVHVLSKQIGATIEYNNSKGSNFEISFLLNTQIL